MVATLLSSYSMINSSSTHTVSTTVTITDTSGIVTEIAPITQTSTQTVTSLRTTTYHSTQTVTATSLTAALSYLPIGTTFHFTENSSFVVFVRYYFYNSSTTTISSSNSSMIYIWGGNYSADVSTSNPNFTINQIFPNHPVVIGGSNNLSEGSIVTYEIHSGPNSSGTYALGVNYLFPEVCAVEFPLIVGNGIPDYASKIIGGCIEWTSNDPSTVHGQLFAEVVGVDDE